MKFEEEAKAPPPGESRQMIRTLRRASVIIASPRASVVNNCVRVTLGC